MFSEQPIRYPENGQSFFSDKGHLDEIAWLSKLFQEFGSYASAYQIGAIRLLDFALNEPAQRDFLVYPIIFLSRHYIELRLKELIQGLNYCANQTRSFPAGHDLAKLWPDFKNKYQAIGEDTTDSSFTAMDSLIVELATVDPISMAFRYPVDKAGIPIQKMETINLAHFRESFVRVSHMFDGISMQISHYVDITQEMMGDIYYNHW